MMALFAKGDISLRPQAVDFLVVIESFGVLLVRRADHHGIARLIAQRHICVQGFTVFEIAVNTDKSSHLSVIVEAEVQSGIMEADIAGRG